jgi:hypothetical protein
LLQIDHAGAFVARVGHQIELVDLVFFQKGAAGDLSIPDCMAANHSARHSTVSQLQTTQADCPMEWA